MPRITCLLLFCLLLAACTSSPDGIRPVDDFDVNRYLGAWYEIARLDHSFERGLSHVRADYELMNDGGLRVVNRGYSREEGRWQEAEGRAYPVGGSHRGHLKVSFFGPFYSAYVVFGLDREDYQYAYISGYNRNYLWLLARDTRVSDERINHFLETAREKGFDTEELIFVSHDPLPED